MSSGCRYGRAIRQSMNKLFDNKSSVHRIISDMIAEYSHKILIKPGTYLFGPNRDFFIIKNVLSQHWVTGFFCPPRLEYLGMETNVVLYHPDLRRKTRIQKKRLYDPFNQAMVRCRSKLYRSIKDEQNSYFQEILA